MESYDVPYQEPRMCQQNFAVLCVDEGSWPHEIMKVDTGAGCKIMSRRPAGSSRDLKPGNLNP